MVDPTEALRPAKLTLGVAGGGDATDATARRNFLEPLTSRLLRSWLSSEECTQDPTPSATLLPREANI